MSGKFDYGFDFYNINYDSCFFAADKLFLLLKLLMLTTLKFSPLACIFVKNLAF